MTGTGTVPVTRFRLLVVLGAVCTLAAAVALSDPAQPPHATSFELAAPVTGPKIAAAGDVACDPASDAFVEGRGDDLECRQLATSDLLVGTGYSAILVLGDVQYEDGAAAAFAESYDPTWGRVKSFTRPVPGNHEYRTPGATGYFGYFGAAAGDAAKGYYSFDVSGWHLVALNSNCEPVGGCHSGSTQERWLRAELDANPARCTLAYWHHPRYSSGRHGSDRTYTAFWQALYDAGAELVLVGHDHGYERFAPQDAHGARDDDRGLREFVVGTGGREVRPYTTVRPNSEARDDASLGVLELTLGTDAYEWRYRAAVGRFEDAGSAPCH